MTSWVTFLRCRAFGPRPFGEKYTHNARAIVESWGCVERADVRLHVGMCVGNRPFGRARGGEGGYYVGFYVRMYV